MTKKLPHYSAIVSLLCMSILLTGCDKFQDKSKPPQIQDLNSVGCLIANDFYAVHFSAYLKPTQNIKELDLKEREALLQPYCQEVPKPGKLFFSADLIDRDVRQTPVGVRVVELEQTGSDETKIESFKEIRTLSEVPAQLYPRGVVEAQADIVKNGYYAMILIIGGEEALGEDDKLKVLFHVGGNPFGLSKKQMMIVGGGVFAFSILIGLLIWFIKRRKAKLRSETI
jgi:hypothetical protein